MEENDVEYLIVGAGTIGLSLAYELACIGKQVTVVDRAAAGRQTSWAAAGIIPAVNSDEHLIDDYERLRALSHRLYPDWTKRLEEDSGIDVEFQACGGLHLARGAGEYASLIAAASLWESDGIQVDRLRTENDWRSLEPSLLPAVDSGRIRGGVYLPGECTVRTPRLVKSLIAACRRLGVQIVEGVNDLKFIQPNSRIEAVSGKSPEGAFRWNVARVCCAAGAWTSQLTSLAFDLDLEVQPWRGQVVLFRAAPQLVRHVINEGPNYLVPRKDGRIFVGSTVEEVGFQLENTDEALSQLRQFAIELLPELADSQLEKTWAGLRPGTGDGWPILGKAAERDNLYIATGHFRSGIFLSPATARVMSQLMTDTTPDVCLDTFNVNRN